METLEIQADAREKKKKRDAKRLLRSGKIPGILYGPKTQAVSLEFDQARVLQPDSGIGRFAFGALEVVDRLRWPTKWRWSKTCSITRLAAM